MDWIESVKTYIKVVNEGSFNQAARKFEYNQFCGK